MRVSLSGINPRVPCQSERFLETLARIQWTNLSVGVYDSGSQIGTTMQ